MMDHLQSVHRNEPEVAKALTFDKSSQERKQLLNLLQTRGNILHNTNVVQSSKQVSKPFGKFASDCSFDASVYCIYCLGLFNKKSFASHLEQCKDKSTQSADGQILPNAGPIPPIASLISPSGLEDIDANIQPSAFHFLNTFYEVDFENEQGSSSLQDLSWNQQPDISSPNEKFRNNRQAEGGILQFRRSPKNEVGYDPNPNSSTGQESTDYKNEKVTRPKCDVEQERAMTLTSDINFIGPHSEYDILGNDDPCDDFSPPQNAQTVCSVKAQTYRTGRKRGRKRRSRLHNQSLIMDDDLLGEGEMSNSKLHVCQHCKATFGSSYTLRRHEYTHTGERPFWCHQCNMGFIQKYRLLKHTFACHGDTPDQEKLKRAKRSIHDVETLVRDEASIEPPTKSLEDLSNAVKDDTGGKVEETRQDTEVRELHWEEAEHSTGMDC